MSERGSISALAATAAESGLLPEGSRGVVLVSGGPDSACAAAAATAVCGPESVTALHLNYRLRPDSGSDERAARDLCARLRIDLHVDRPELGGGNVQAAAREARYRAAERLRLTLDADWIATGHTRSDLAETVLYRLAASPGTRALLGLAPRQGRIVRPLHSLSRGRARELAVAAGLPFVDDPSNEDPRFARNRIRSEVLPVLGQIASEAERNIVATHAELHEEAELLERVTEEALERAGAGGEARAVRAEEILPLEPALRRRALRALAERAAGERVPLSRARAAEIVRLASHPEGGEVDLGGRLVAICEAGLIRLERRRASLAPPEPVRMPVPGAVRYGDWELRAELRPPSADREVIEASGPELAALDPDELGDEVEVRAWRAGDRIRPLGLGGSKSLQDLFTDARVPRSLRSRLPVVTSGERVVWVAGVAVSEEFRVGPSSRRAAVLTARAIE